MSATIVNNATKRALLQIITDIDSICEVGLYTDGPIATDRVAVPGDFTEATFSGYARQGVAFPTPSLVMDGEADSVAPTLSFVNTGTAPETIEGVYILYNPGTESVYAFQAFALPITVSSPGDTINIVLTADLLTPIV